MVVVVFKSCVKSDSASAEGAEGEGKERSCVYEVREFVYIGVFGIVERDRWW